jgi:hypothetical protein
MPLANTWARYLLLSANSVAAYFEFTSRFLHTALMKNSSADYDYCGFLETFDKSTNYCYCYYYYYYYYYLYLIYGVKSI